MAQPSGVLGFPAETFPEIGIFGKVDAQHLYRDLPTNERVGGREHLAHATGADDGTQFIAISDHEGHCAPPTSNRPFTASIKSSAGALVSTGTLALVLGVEVGI